MANEKTQAQIRDKVKEMTLSQPAEEALIESTIRLYDELKSKEVFHMGTPTDYPIATALYLACDSHACIAIPKVKRVCRNSLRGKHITQARKALQLYPTSAHEKLDHLYKSSGIADKKLLEKAHYFISLLDGHKSYMPTNLAASAFYEAGRQLNPFKHTTQREISDLTGCQISSMMNISEDLHRKYVALDELKELRK